MAENQPFQAIARRLSRALLRVHTKRQVPNLRVPLKSLGTLRGIVRLGSMQRHPSKGTIRPKISTMPRQASEAAAFLDVYKLVVEKKRLQQELQHLDARRQQICDRLTVLDAQVAALESSVQQMRSSDHAQTPASLGQPLHHPMPDNFDMLFLEY